MSFTRKCPECGGPMVPGAGAAINTYRCLECGRMEKSQMMTPERVDVAKTDVVIGVLITMCEGPREAYAVLATCIWRLNFELNEGNTVSIDDLCAEVTETLRSITGPRKSQ